MMYLMPTNNPRITITLEPATYARLRRLSELTDQSLSAIVSEILDGSAQVFDRTITVLEAAKSATEEMREKTAADLAAAQTKLEQQLGLSLEVFDGYTESLLEDAEAVRRRARRGGPALRGASPRPTTRWRCACCDMVLEQDEKPRECPGCGQRRWRLDAVPTPMSNRGVRSTPRKAKDHKTRG